MANSATVNSLVTLVRARLNLTNMNTITDTELRLFIRSSMAQLYELLCNRHKDYFARPYLFDLSPNQETYPLPENFRSNVQTSALSGTPPQVRRIPMSQFTWEERTTSPLINCSPSLRPRYRIVDTLIYIQPIPQQVIQNAIELIYVPQFQAPINDDASIGRQLPNGWERWVEFDASVQTSARMRLAEYYSLYSKERDKVEASVIAGASIRDEQPATSTDAVGWGGYTGYYGNSGDWWY